MISIFKSSSLWKKLLIKKDFRLIMVGLDAAGKTTVIYQIKMDNSVTTITKPGFNVEILSEQGFTLNCWDLGGQDRVRLLWKPYYQNTDGIIFVVDSNDRNNIDSASEELVKLLSEEELQDCCLLVMANKQDISGAMSLDEITKELELSQIKGRQWLVQGTSATTGQGLKEGLDWVAGVLTKKTKTKI